MLGAKFNSTLTVYIYNKRQKEIIKKETNKQIKIKRETQRNFSSSDPKPGTNPRRNDKFSYDTVRNPREEHYAAFLSFLAIERHASSATIELNRVEVK